MPQPTKPPALKSIAGSREPSRPVVELPVVDAAPDAPDWLPNGHAIKEWNRLAPILTANRLLTEGGISALGMLCALHGKIVQLFAAGESPTGHMVAQYRNFVNDFGLTPVAQGKVRQVGDQSPKNKFAANGKRSA